MPNTAKAIKIFVRNAIEKHLCDVEHGDYKKLAELLNSELLLELSKYLENSQDEKFEETLHELLEENELRTNK